jgi:hypothetical protein
VSLAVLVPVTVDRLGPILASIHEWQAHGSACPFLINTSITTQVRPAIFISSYLHIFISSYLHIFISSYLHIFILQVDLVFFINHKSIDPFPASDFQNRVYTALGGNAHCFGEVKFLTDPGVVNTLNPHLRSTCQLYNAHHYLSLSGPVGSKKGNVTAVPTVVGAGAGVYFISNLSVMCGNSVYFNI